MSDDYDVPQIVEKKALLSGKRVYRFNSQEYQTREEAENARRIEVENRAKQAEQAREFQRKQREIEAELELRRIEYDSDPVYMSVHVRCQYIADVRESFFGPKETGMAAWVDLDALTFRIYDACRELSIHGYDVISITPAISGVGRCEFRGTNPTSAGAGWGYSFTNGAVVTGRKRGSSLVGSGDLSLDDGLKKCPSCAEFIKLEAIKCHFCGHPFDSVELDQVLEERRKEKRRERMAIEAFFAAQRKDGLTQCPQCKKWDVRQGAYIEDGSIGDWCPNCNKSLQKMRGKI